MPIQQLAPNVAAQIAAGEVVERPASVVKELVENALDAGAKQIHIEVMNGGLQLIHVTDDGSGIPAAELELAFARHATSKISRLADLERVRSLGFRGEALASMGTVARVTLRSCPRGEEMGAEICMDCGQTGNVTPAAAVVGTSVTVRDLFAAVPARLKFLKTRATEAGRVIQVVEQYALAFPEVRFTVESERRQVFATPGDGKLYSALVAVYGLRIAEQMVPLSASSRDGLTALPESGDGARPQIDGYVSRPSCYKSNRHSISFFVNRRWVQNRTLAYAVEEAYHSLLLLGRHPIAVININVDPAMLDVNVHPAKTEVKFLHERTVFSMLQRAVRSAVLATAAPLEVSPRAFGVPAWESLVTRAASDHLGSADRQDTGEIPHLEPSDDRPPDSINAAPEQLELPKAVSGFAAAGVSTAGSSGGQTLPVLRVLGQINESYIITEGPDGVYLVDQHAAHERILLGRMIAEWRGRAVSSQFLLQPLPIELSVHELETVEEHLPVLRAVGFELEEFGDFTFLVRSVPAALLASKTRLQPLRELLLELVGADREAASHGETWEEHALANVACKAAIKAGQVLSPEEQRELIRQLESTEARQSCCHGRPTMVHISLTALERQFDRR